MKQRPIHTSARQARNWPTDLQANKTAKLSNRTGRARAPVARSKVKCTTSKERRVRRWEKEDVLDQVQKRLDKDPAQLPVRSMTVEHPYGTIKSWMGATHFKMRTLTEMALYVLAYNMTRVMNIMGVPAMIAAMKA